MRRSVFILALMAAKTWGAQVTFAPVNQNTADILITGLGLLQVGTFSITLDFSPALISITGAASQGHLGTAGLESVWSAQSLPNQFQIGEVSLLTAAELAGLQPQSFPLARVSFQLLGSGGAIIELSGLIGDAAGDPISTTFVPGTVIGVPEPGSLTLFTLGAAMLLGSLVPRGCVKWPFGASAPGSVPALDLQKSRFFSDFRGF